MTNKLILGAVALCVLSGAAHAEDAAASLAPVTSGTTVAPKGKFAISPKLSTLGVGIEGMYAIRPNVVLRANVQGAPALSSKEKVNVGALGNVDHKKKLNLFSTGLFVDYHPMSNGLALSVGALYNRNNLETKYDLNGVSTGVSSRIRYAPIAPAALVRYDATFTRDNSWGFTAEAGVMYQGTPRVKISDASGTFSAAQLNAIKDAVKKREDKNIMRFYPIVSAGVTYRF